MTSRKGRPKKFTKAEEFYILHSGQETEKLAEELGQSVKTIESFISKNTKDVEPIKKEEPLEAQYTVDEVRRLEWNAEKRVWFDPESGKEFNGPPPEETDTKTTVEVKKQVAAGLNPGNLMGRNERYGAVVMTPAASELGDHTRARRKGSNKKMESAIFKPFGDKKRKR